MILLKFLILKLLLPVIWKYTDIETLDARILNELIEKIVVHEKTILPDGTKCQRVDIHYKFIGYIDNEEALRNDEFAEALTGIMADLMGLNEPA